MSIVRIATHFNIDIEFTAPPFYRRLAAWVIDIVIQIVYLIVALRLLNWLTLSMPGNDSNMKVWALSLLLFLPLALYHVILEITMQGQSIGKKLLGIKVVSENGGRPSIGQFIIRWLMRTMDISVIMMIMMIPYAQMFGPQVYWGMAISMGLLVTDLVLVNTRKQQRLGDILARTVLIDTKQNEKISDTVFLEVENSYVPLFPQIMQLSDRDMNSLKGILDASRRHRDSTMAMMAAEKIKAHLKIETDLEPETFLEVLLKDYNYLSAN
ncbi:RDD family protein [Flavisolibacter sp. BT320]|nr:RDD family protein [Flavisolibacter longurius]